MKVIDSTEFNCYLLTYSKLSKCDTSVFLSLTISTVSFVVTEHHDHILLLFSDLLSLGFILVYYDKFVSEYL